MMFLKLHSVNFTHSVSLISFSSSSVPSNEAFFFPNPNQALFLFNRLLINFVFNSRADDFICEADVSCDITFWGTGSKGNIPIGRDQLFFSDVVTDAIADVSRNTFAAQPPWQQVQGGHLRLHPAPVPRGASLTSLAA